MNKILFLSALICFTAVLWFSNIDSTEAFLVFLGNTTACDTCDEYQTYSGRNVMCCLAQSKCCGPNNFDDVDKPNQ